MKYALLIHLLGWENQDDKIVIDDGLMFVNLSKHPAGKLYKKICKMNGVDEGDPYHYDTALILYDKNQNDYSYFPAASNYSVSTTIINILTIIYSGTLGQCRVVCSKNDFRSAFATYMLYEPQTDYITDIQVYHSKLDKNNIEILKTILKNLMIVGKNGQNLRIDNALNFFYSSWNTLTLEQTAICLSIVLESLFSPHSNSEIIHQIAFNIGKFVGKNKIEKMELYKQIKKFYSIRSKLVHGEIINEKELSLIPEFFKFICNLLLKILSDINLITMFNDNELRRSFLENQIFE